LELVYFFSTFFGVSWIAMKDEEKGIENNVSRPADSAVTKTASQIRDDPAFIVKWDTNDPDNPLNWSHGYKSWVVFQLSMLALAASVASSMIAPANPILARYLGVSDTVVVLDISLFVYDFSPTSGWPCPY
jgi:hypothetical protein